MTDILSPTALGLSADDFQRRSLSWAAGYDYCAYFVPAVGFAGPGGAFEHLLAVGRADAASPGPLTLAELASWLATATTAPRCGFLTYELKNEVEALTSNNPDGHQWPGLHFFQAEAWLRWQADGTVAFHGSAGTLAELRTALNDNVIPAIAPAAVPPLRPRLPRPDYLRAVEAVRADILSGEVYELNLCQEFYAENVVLPPVDTFLRLLAASPTPFAGFYKYGSQYLLCASPERFLQRTGGQLLSQPIKGTIRRGSSAADDEAQRQALLRDEKERAENLMIVDLVRNDLARVARTGTVQVPELFGTYGFRHVWQMISSVTATVWPGIALADVLRATFPMGSMTGAPKIRAMQLIEQYERSRRSLYSGSLGYLWPNGDFDFNVVIRSLLYRADTGYLSFQVGSAITYDSDAEREYEECLLKAQALLEVLNSFII